MDHWCRGREGGASKRSQRWNQRQTNTKHNTNCYNNANTTNISSKGRQAIDHNDRSTPKITASDKLRHFSHQEDKVTEAWARESAIRLGSISFEQKSMIRNSGKCVGACNAIGISIRSANPALERTKES